MQDLLGNLNIEQRQKQKHPRSQFDEVRDEILEIINKENARDGYPKWSVARLMRLLKKAKYIDGKHKDLWGLSQLLGSMKDSNQPTRTFWWRINTRTGKYKNK